MRFTHAIALIVLLPAIALAQDGPERPSEGQRLAEFLKRFPTSDADKDGTLTREEVQEFNKKRREASDGNQRPNRERPKPTAADVEYGKHQRQRFDIWAVPNAKQPTPLVIFIHGGGFRGGDKKAFNPALVEYYHQNGIAFAAMNYRLSDVGPYPIMMEDCARGLQTIRHRAAEWNINPKKIGSFGGSAGAGISLWLAFHDDLAKPDSKDPVARQSTRLTAAGTSGGQSTYDMRTFRKWFGVPDLEPHSALLTFYAVKNEDDWTSKRVIGLMEAASAINHLSKDDNAPVYMTYNRGDVPITKESDANVWVHHYRLGLKLQEAMKKLDKECHVTHQKQSKRELKYANMQEFFVDKLVGRKPRQR